MKTSSVPVYRKPAPIEACPAICRQHENHLVDDASDGILASPATKHFMASIPMSRKSALLALLLLAAASGCGFSERDDFMPVQTLSAISNSDQLLVSFLTNTTLWSYSDPRHGGHGTQLEYHASNGMTYLWYPGNKAAVLGKWKVVPHKGGKPELCYMYGQNTFNPVLSLPGGSWECRTLAFADIGVGVRGDPFGLASGGLPFVIEDREFHAVKDLHARLGGTASPLDFITNLDELAR